MKPNCMFIDSEGVEYTSSPELNTEPIIWAILGLSVCNIGLVAGSLFVCFGGYHG